MPAAEVQGWQAFYTLQPFGPSRDNYHSAQIAHILASVNSRKGKAPSFSEFMYKDPVARQAERDRRVFNMFFSDEVH